MATKKRTTRTSLMGATDMELRQRLLIAAETTAEAAERIVELLEHPTIVGATRETSAAVDVNVLRARRHAQFVRETRRIIDVHEVCRHEDMVLWTEIDNMAVEVLGMDEWKRNGWD